VRKDGGGGGSAVASASLGALLRAHRLAAGLTQEALAERAAVGARSVQGIEEGERQPRRETIRRLAQALGLAGSPLARFEAAARPAPRRHVARPGDVPRNALQSPDVGSSSRPSLPIPPTSFVGRERDVAEITRRLRGEPADNRLITLVGAGGCGKSRLALQIARGLLEHYSDGVWLVELASLADPALVVPTVANVLGVNGEAGHRAVLATLLDWLRPRQLLLVLDNCELLVDACAELTDAMLRFCPTVQILATSREDLRVAGEVSWRVPGLAVPTGDSLPPPGELGQIEAVRLFLDRARLSQPAFALTSENAPAIAHICQRLDGIPLALELAVGRLKYLSVEQIAARLDQRFRLLTVGSRAALPRHQTLQALVDWSYDLLSEPEQRLFNRLAVFAGGFTLEAAEWVSEPVLSGAKDVGCQVSGDAGIPSPSPSPARRGGTPRPLTPGTSLPLSLPLQGRTVTRHLAPDTLGVVDLLTRLVEKSLVVAEPGDDGGQRYRLLETLRQYAWEKLVAGGEGEIVRERHAAYYLALARRPRLRYSWNRIVSPGMPECSAS
jgi:predicted ATPase/DNA-binding XRE family transcriptional regulator